MICTLAFQLAAAIQRQLESDLDPQPSLRMQSSSRRSIPTPVATSVETEQACDWTSPHSVCNRARPSRTGQPLGQMVQSRFHGKSCNAAAVRLRSRRGRMRSS